MTQPLPLGLMLFRSMQEDGSHLLLEDDSGDILTEDGLNIVTEDSPMEGDI
jgi:hypothetical protein